MTSTVLAEPVDPRHTELQLWVVDKSLRMMPMAITPETITPAGNIAGGRLLETKKIQIGQTDGSTVFYQRSLPDVPVAGSLFVTDGFHNWTQATGSDHPNFFVTYSDTNRTVFVLYPNTVPDAGRDIAATYRKELDLATSEFSARILRGRTAALDPSATLDYEPAIPGGAYSERVFEITGDLFRWQRIEVRPQMMTPNGALDLTEYVYRQVKSLIKTNGTNQFFFVRVPEIIVPGSLRLQDGEFEWSQASGSSAPANFSASYAPLTRSLVVTYLNTIPEAGRTIIVDYDVAVRNALASFVRLSEPLYPPSVSAVASNIEVEPGGTAILEVTFTGSGPMEFQWYAGETGDTSAPIKGATSASFTTSVLSQSAQYWVRAQNLLGSTNSDTFTVTVPEFARIPSGWFVMGRTSDDSDSDAPPVNVFVSEFYMATHEVTWELWDDVRIWALNNGYSDIVTGGGKASTHPVHSVNWWDVVKWCNARSEREGLTPVYRNTNGTVFKIGTNDPVPNRNANGYRLPTEAEWEKAARGGVAGQRFPWGDEINHSHANYRADGSQYSYDTSPYTTSTYHPTYNDDTMPYTAPVGSFSTNGYGLHDMAGNVWEWCWDWYSASTYTEGTGDPRGPASGSIRVLRGGSWGNSPINCRSASRITFHYPVSRNFNYGFRLARNSTSLPVIKSFEGLPEQISAGETTTLSWSVSGATSVEIDNGIGAVAATGSIDVAPDSTTTYTLTAINGHGVSQGEFAVIVYSDFARIPAGWFAMGRISGDIDSDAPPVNVYVSEFYIAKQEVTWELWDDVRNWALNNGYTDIATGGGKGSTHPVHSVNWWDVVKWCNARSEREGFTPVYHNTNGTVFKIGTNAPTPNWNTNGYRLPTEAEWEKAARGGLSGQRFPWGDEINHSHANYRADGSQYSYDTSPFTTSTYHPTYSDGTMPYTAPVGSFAPNGYGLHDMAGNVWEWCWDWYSASTYSEGSGDPKGPASGSIRVLRGGSWGNFPINCRSASRITFHYPVSRNFNYGFRLARNSDSTPSPIAATRPPTHITGGDATLHGTVNPGGIASTAFFEYGPSPDYGSTVSVTLDPADGTSDQLVSATLSGLAPGETIHYRLIITNAFGTTTGEDMTFTTPPDDFSTIPTGTFTMGNTSGDTDEDASSVKNVHVSEFYMATHEVTWELWNEVRTWAMNRPVDPYTDIATGGGKAATHPVHSVNWWDVVKWCNARSEMDGLTPVYSVGGNVMRTGTTAPVANWNASGYRLPTEAEWEKAARGGVSGQRFPWGDTISHSQANYRSTSFYSYDTSPTGDYHPTYFDGTPPYTSPVGSFAPNGYGLFDMAGNVWEWNWDWYSASTYTEGASDPKGAVSGSNRVLRGGGWNYGAFYCRSAYRGHDSPGVRNYDFGFRSARSSVP